MSLTSARLAHPAGKARRPSRFLGVAFWLHVAAFGFAVAAHNGLLMVGVSASVSLLGLIGLWRARGTVHGWLEPSRKES